MFLLCFTVCCAAVSHLVAINVSSGVQNDRSTVSCFKQYKNVSSASSASSVLLLYVCHFKTLLIISYFQCNNCTTFLFSFLSCILLIPISDLFLSLFQIYCCHHCGVISTKINSFDCNKVLSIVSVLVCQGQKGANKA